ncbi:MAG TPA: sulfatase-like hydrolase/transferase [Planctomycetota bacterium]
MNRATPPRGERPRPAPRPSHGRFEGWLAVALCTVVLLASTAILERSRSFSRVLIELERGERATPRSRAPADARAEPVGLVILVALDGLRADRLRGPGAREAAPRLARLRDEALAFEQALAPAAHALVAHKALLSGRSPGLLMLEETGADLLELAAVREPADYLRATFERVQPHLAETFRAGGFRTAAFTDGIVLTTEAGFARGFEQFDASGGGLAATLGRALAWLERVRGRRAFLFVQSSELAGCVPGEEAGRHGGAAPEAAYAARLARLDAELGTFLDGLRARGLYEPALLVLTAAHGFALGEGATVGHGGLSLAELSVPLLLKFPQEHEQVPGTPAQPVELVDLAPTLLEACGLAPPAGLDGRALVALARRGGRACLVAETVLRGVRPGEASASASTFVRPGRWQVTHDPALAQASYADLRTDPTGHAARALPAEVAPALLDALLERARPALRPRLRAEGEPPAELVQALAELGYAEEARLSSGPDGP